MSRPTLTRVQSKPIPVPLPAGRRPLQRSDGAGAGGTPRSQSPQSPTPDAASFDKVVPGPSSSSSSTPTWTLETWTAAVSVHEEMLLAELRKNSGHDVAHVEEILKILVAKNYVVHPVSPGFIPEETAKVLAERFPTLGPVTLEVPQQTSAMARQTSETARRLAKRVEDPASRQLLESVAKFWDMYVRPEPNRARAAGHTKTPSNLPLAKRATHVAVDSETPAPRPVSRTHVGVFSKPVANTPVPKLLGNITNKTNNAVGTPRITTTSTTSTAPITTTAAVSSARVSPRKSTPPTAKEMRQRDAQALQNPDVILERAKQRDVLFAALSTKSPIAIAQAMGDIPDQVTLASYFPVANPDKFRRELSTAARQYATTFHLDDGLVDYIDWYEIYNHRTVLSEATLALYPDLMSSIKPDVIELCKTLRALDELDDKATMKKCANTVRKLVHSKRITRLSLSQQPLASTRMMLQKCTLLKKHMGIIDRKAFEQFQAMLEEAHAWRKTSRALLQQALLRTSVHEPDVVELAVIAYARAVTIPTAGYIQPDATPAQLNTMLEALNKVTRTPKTPLTALQSEALADIQRSVMERVG